MLPPLPSVAEEEEEDNTCGGFDEEAVAGVVEVGWCVLVCYEVLWRQEASVLEVTERGQPEETAV